MTATFPLNGPWLMYTKRPICTNRLYGLEREEEGEGEGEGDESVIEDGWENYCALGWFTVRPGSRRWREKHGGGTGQC